MVRNRTAKLSWSRPITPGGVVITDGDVSG
jgi:hypothetical protein